MVAPLTPPRTLKPLPLADACDTVTLEFPALTRFTPSVLDPPTVSLPKFKTEVEASKEREVFSPVPFTLMNASVVPLADSSVTDPVTLPTADGKNPSVKDFVAPDASVSGAERSLTENALPATAAL